jgi:Heparinase II/III-like protein
MLENLHSNGYRDFRVSTQVFFYALTKQIVYDDESLNENIFWRFGKISNLDLLIIEKPAAEILDNQMLLIHNKIAAVMVKIPEDTFRPGNDAFHIDLWVDSKNILRDNGSYSYNDKNLSDLFKSVASHNTIQFDNHEQMPKISRFLNGSWIKPHELGEITTEENLISWQGAYKDYKGNFHHRKINLTDTKLEIEDTINTNESAKWRLHYNQANLNKYNIKIETSLPNNISTSKNSSYYLECHEDEVFEIPLDTRLITTILFQNK